MHRYLAVFALAAVRLASWRRSEWLPRKSAPADAPFALCTSSRILGARHTTEVEAR